MPVLKGIDGVNLTFSASENMDFEDKDFLIRSGINVLSQSEFFKYEKTKIIIVAVPPSSQLQISKNVLENKKNLYIEKPAGVNFTETSILEVTRKMQAQKAYVGFQFRFDPGISALKELMESKILGNFKQIKVNWHTSGSSARQDESNWRNNIKLGGGVHRDFLCHVIDYLKWLTRDSINQSLERLILDPKIDSDLYNLNLISGQSKENVVSINISRGFESISYWEISLQFESGNFLIKSSFPFSLNDYHIQINGSKKFNDIATEFVNSRKILNNSLNQGLARDYALNSYFGSIIKNVFEGYSTELPDLEDAKFTQFISDQIQEQLTQG